MAFLDLFKKKDIKMGTSTIIQNADTSIDQLVTHNTSTVRIAGSDGQFAEVSNNKIVTLTEIDDPTLKQISPTHRAFDGIMFSFPPTAVRIQTNVEPIYYLTNPTGNTKSFLMEYILFQILTANAKVEFKNYFNPTLTNSGTMVTPINHRSGSPITSTAGAYFSPKVSQYGNIILHLNILYGQIFNFDISKFIIEPGNSFLVSVKSDTQNTDILVGMAWSEI